MTVRLMLNPSRSHWIEYVFLLVGLAGVDAYIWTNVSTDYSQVYDNWALDQQVRTAKESKQVPERVKLEPLALVGRVEIPRLGLAAVVREGVDGSVLQNAVGHLPSTALPGDPGNVAIAAHRDTLFRKLRGIRKSDRITMETPDGTTYDYQVQSMKIVEPTDVSVLKPVNNEQSLTLITCYPFNYVGAAPNRFIVRARRVDLSASAGAAN